MMLVCLAWAMLLRVFLHGPNGSFFLTSHNARAARLRLRGTAEGGSLHVNLKMNSQNKKASVS